jgi:hypothetical protein
MLPLSAHLFSHWLIPLKGQRHEILDQLLLDSQSHILFKSQRFSKLFETGNAGP